MRNIADLSFYFNTSKEHPLKYGRLSIRLYQQLLITIYANEETRVMPDIGIFLLGEFLETFGLCLYPPFLP